MQNRFVGGMVIALGLLLADLPSIGQSARSDRVVRPVPRWPDGRVNLNSPPGEKGLWGGSGRLAINPKSYEPRTTLAAPIHINNVPLQDWARALVDYRHGDYLKDEPNISARKTITARN